MGLISFRSSQNISKVKSEVEKRKRNSGLPIAILRYCNNGQLKAIEVTLPIRTISPNVSEHWTKKHKRQKKEKRWLWIALLEKRHLLRLPCKVTFIRYGKRELDQEDNLPMSIKFLKDQVAELLTGLPNGRGDSNKEIIWIYKQEKAKTYSLKIILEF
jgi:hypothetical protein